MRITRNQLRQIIQEELDILKEVDDLAQPASQQLPVGNELRNKVREIEDALLDLYLSIVDREANLNGDGPFTKYSDDVWKSQEHRERIIRHFKEDRGPQNMTDIQEMVGTLRRIALATEA